MPHKRLWEICLWQSLDSTTRRNLANLSQDYGQAYNRLYDHAVIWRCFCKIAVNRPVNMRSCCDLEVSLQDYGDAAQRLWEICLWQSLDSATRRNLEMLLQDYGQSPAPPCCRIVIWKIFARLLSGFLCSGLMLEGSEAGVCLRCRYGALRSRCKGKYMFYAAHHRSYLYFKGRERQA